MLLTAYLDFWSLIVFALSVCLFVCLFTCLSLPVCLWHGNQLVVSFTTQVRSRLLSEPEKLVTSPAQSELPPAIPAMLSKAKGLLKKKLKVPSEDSFSLPSPTPPMEEETICKREEEVDSEEMECPPEVEELVRSSTKTRWGPFWGFIPVVTF